MKIADVQRECTISRYINKKIHGEMHQTETQMKDKLEYDIRTPKARY